MRIAPPTILAALCLAIAGCAVAPKAALPSLAFPRLSAAEERGRAFAYRRCGGCHNVGRDDVAKEGPPFMKLALRYNTLTLKRRFAEVSEHGAGLMQPVTFTHAEAADLLEYVNSLSER